MTRPHLIEAPCTQCETVKPRADYYESKEGWLRQPCKPCHRSNQQIRHRQAVREDPEGVAKKMKRRNRRVNLAKYGLTLDDYDRLHSAQEGRCLICDTETDYNLAVDHCHDTGEVRGLLCIPCNVGIGNLGDDPDRLRAAADYLENYR